MIKDIVKDPIILTRKCKMANAVEDRWLMIDLLDTAEHHRETDNCVGLACNQIGGDKRLIVAWNGRAFFGLMNPVIVKKSKTTHMSEEGCLSLDGTRTVKRYDWVKVISIDPFTGKSMFNTFRGQLAVIIQHEIDHLNGKLI